MDSTYDDSIDQVDIAIPSHFEEELNALFNDNVWNATNDEFNDMFMEPDSQGPSHDREDIDMVIRALDNDPLEPSAAEVIAKTNSTTVFDDCPNESAPLVFPHSIVPEPEMLSITESEFEMPTVYATGAQDMMFSAPENLIPV